MLLEIDSGQRVFETLYNGLELVEVPKRVVSICRECSVVSPMICVERCQIWKIKNELLELNKTIHAENHLPSLYNAIKNDQRRIIIETLAERPRTLKKLQEHLKDKGHHHSLSTVHKYIEPLLDVGLVRESNDIFRLTLYGQRVKDVLRSHDIGHPFPSRSNCYEETILRELKSRPRTYTFLTETVPKNVLSRSVQRLNKKGLISKTESSAHVYYFKTKKVPKEKFTPTEKRVYQSIPEVGISARQLSREVGISPRRIYKYLRKLRGRRLVFTRKRPKTYRLTPSGREVANFLEETENLTINASNASFSLISLSRDTASAPYSEFNMVSDFLPKGGQDADRKKIEGKMEGA